ncbi:MAG: hypothetical protein QOE46_666 [Acidobacteriota bacterium]|jgi:cell division septation protein DedD|nr:hypothetical protein [Acidobacteriota bacterium]
MAYEFSLDGKSLWALTGGSAVLCLLIFFAGILLGANWGSHEAATPSTRGAIAANAQPAPVMQNADATAAAAVPVLPYTAPQEPVVYNLPERQGYASPQGYAPQNVGAQSYAAQGYAARAPESSDYGVQQRYAAVPTAPAAAVAAREVAATPPVNLNREAARLSSTGVDSDPRLVSEASADAAESASTGSANYTVQVGVFLDEADARRLVGDLENKGYTPTIFSGRDAEGRSWYAARIGAYANQHEAAQAANNFSRQEKMKGSVRPFNSL